MCWLRLKVITKSKKNFFINFHQKLYFECLAKTLHGQYSNQNIHLNGFAHFPLKTFTVSEASLINADDDVEFDIGSSTQNAKQTIGVVFISSNLKFIPQQIFETFPALQVLYVDGQQLTDLKQIYFNGATSLRTLWAPNNEITEIGANTFSYMGNLFTLDLSNNPINYIHSLGFSGIARLTILNLSGTKLMKMSFASFWFLFQLNNINFINANGNTNCLNRQFKPIPGKLEELKAALSRSCVPSEDQIAEIDNADKKTIENLEKSNNKFQNEIVSLKDAIEKLGAATPEPCTADDNDKTLNLIRENNKLKREKADLLQKNRECTECCTEVDTMNETITDLEASLAMKSKKLTSEIAKTRKLRKELTECIDGSNELPGPCDCKKSTKVLQDKVDKLTSDLAEEVDKCSDSARQASELEVKNKVLENKISQMASGGTDCGKFPLLTRALVKACLNAPAVDVEASTRTSFLDIRHFQSEETIIFE